MHHTAKKIEPLSAYQEVGFVQQIDETLLWVDAGAGEYPARRALSCLVEPMVGDRVLVAIAGNDAFVLAVLQREATGVTLGVPGDLDVKVAAGQLRIAAKGGIDLASNEYVGMTAAHFRLTAHTSRILVSHLSHVGKAVSATLDHLNLETDTLDSTVGRVKETITRAYRFVREFDHVRAGRIDYSAKETMSLRGANTMLTAKELVKVDGSQIHLG